MTVCQLSEIEHRAINQAMDTIMACRRDHELRFDRPVPDTFKLFHGQHGPTFTMSSKAIETSEGVWAVEEWLRGIHARRD